MKSYMKKRYLAVIIVGVIVIILVCVYILNSYFKEISIGSEVSRMLEHEGLENCRIVKLGNYKEFYHEVDEITISKEDIDNYIEQELMNERVLEEITDTDKAICDKFNVDSVQEAYEYVKNLLYEEKKSEQRIQMENAFVQYVVDQSKFEMDEEAVEKYAATNAIFYDNIAFSNGMTLEQYANQYDDFYGDLYNEAEYDVKMFLVIGAIAFKENIKVDISQFEDICKKYNYSEAYLNENPEIEIYVYYNLLETKVFDFIFGSN